MEEAWVKRSGAGLAVVIAAAVLLMLLLAAPAMAAPFATSLTASPNQAIVDLGDSAIISAVLTDTDSMLPVGGQPLWVEQASSRGGPWSLLNIVTSEGDETGYSLEVYPEATTYYRFVFLGTDTYAAVTSNVVTILIPAGPPPYATSLTASPDQTTVVYGDSATISAELTDTVNALPVGGETVRVQQATSIGGPWSLSDSVTNDGSSGQYSLDVAPTTKTYYRFVFDVTGTYLTSTSNVVTVDVVPAPTTLTASPAQATVVFGAGQTISAVLTETQGGAPFGGQQVRVEQATSAGGPWSLVQIVTNDVASGVCSLAVKPPQTTYYRFVFAGSADHAAATSNVVNVQVTPASTSLTASPGEATITSGASQTISAALMDTSNALAVGGAQLRVEMATSSSGPWSLVQTVTNGGTTGNYALAVQPPRTTYYRFVYEGAGTYVAVTSNVLTVNVTRALTSLTASPGEKTVTAGSTQTISAVLTQTSGALPIGGASLRVEQATSTSGPWSLVQTVSNGGTTGDYSLAVTPVQTTYYRFAYEGTDAYAAVTSGALTIKVKPVLKTPTCPSSIKKSKTFKVKGTVTPGAPNGPAVKIQAYRKVNGKWAKYKSARSTSRSGMNYSASIKMPSTGTYKFKATVAGSAKFVTVTSAYSRVLTVKK